MYHKKLKLSLFKAGITGQKSTIDDVFLECIENGISDEALVFFHKKYMEENNESRFWFVIQDVLF